MKIQRFELPLGDRMMALHLLQGRENWLVDTGVCNTPDKLQPFLAEAGISFQEIDGAVVTHCDTDHCGGNASIKDRVPGVELLAHEQDASLMEDHERCIRERYDFGQPYGYELPEDTRTRLLDDLGQEVAIDRRLGGQREKVAEIGSASVWHAPGHTNGHLVVLVEEQKTAVITDAVLGAYVPDEEGAPLMAPTVRYYEPYLDTIDMLRSADLTRLYPTHFSVIEGAEKVDEFLDRSEQFMRRYRRRVKDVIAASDRALSLPDLVETLKSDVADWADPEKPFVAYSLCYPTAAVLDDMVDDGELSTTRRDHIRHYESV